MADVLSTRELRRALRCLRAAAPAGAVTVRRLDLGPDHDGWAHLSDGRARIELHSGLTRDRAMDKLAHEWAHVLAWRRHGTEIEDHGDEWGLAYAEAYRGLRCEWERRRFDRA